MDMDPPSQQFGFRTGICADFQLYRLLEVIKYGLSNRQATGTVSIDFGVLLTPCLYLDPRGGVRTHTAPDTVI